MRMRTLKPGFFENDVLAAMPMAARLLFAGLWCYADREGRFEWRPARIKVAVLPYDDIPIAEHMEALVFAGFLRRYKVDGVEYGDIPAFAEHQRPHIREMPSAIPGYTKAMPRQDLGDAKAVPGPRLDVQSLGVSTVVGTGGCGGTVSVGAAPPAARFAGDVAVKAKKKQRKEQDPTALALCERLGDCIAHWKPDARITCESSRSVEDMHRLLAVDGREPERVKSVMGWLFGGLPDDYQPDDGFDWRPNIASGGALRKQWDRLDSLYEKAITAQPVAATNGGHNGR